ncbi:MAG: MBL fold metallo-hydrolase [Clostridiales bacterium]|nr:MBL fold metallo-hydrolase [Clostridiales bacterium]
MEGITITDVRIHPGDNGFLMDDGNTAVLWDTGFGFTGCLMAERIQSILGDRPLDYIFLSHSHYDHAMGTAQLVRRWPKVKVVALEYVKNIFSRPGARRTMAELDGKIAKKCGILQYENPIDELRVDVAVKDGDTIRAGEMEFTVIALPGHTKCSVGYYSKQHDLLLCSETLGGYYGSGDVVPCYLVGYEMTLDSLKKAEALEPGHLLLPHYGVIGGETVKWYFKRAAEAAKEAAEHILTMLKEGKSEEMIVQCLMERYYHGSITVLYPIDAFLLNMSIMVRLIQKELME